MYNCNYNRVYGGGKIFPSRDKIKKLSLFLSLEANNEEKKGRDGSGFKINLAAIFAKVITSGKAISALYF